MAEAVALAVVAPEEALAAVAALVEVSAAVVSAAEVPVEAGNISVNRVVLSIKPINLKTLFFY